MVRQAVAMLVMVLAWSCAVGAEPRRAPAALTETDKIESLIRTVEGLRGGVFVRNGQTYDGRTAAKHMRTKWRWQAGSIKTARDFIRLVASTSSQSGQPYLIRWNDGREEKSADFLGGALDRLEGKGDPAKKG
jgi:hypothetical protein